MDVAPDNFLKWLKPFQARQFELAGEPKIAEEIWRKDIKLHDDLSKKMGEKETEPGNNSYLSSKMIDLDEIGDMYDRLGKYDKARDAYEECMKILTPGCYEWASQQEKIGFSVWALGDEMGAYHHFSLAARAMDVMNAKWLRDDDMVNSVCAAYVLARTVMGKANQKITADWVEALAKKVSDKPQYSTNLALLYFSSKLDHEEVSAVLNRVLKEAPHLDWALWTGLFINVTDTDGAKAMLEKMPKGCIQRTILSRYVEAEKKKDELNTSSAASAKAPQKP